MPYPSLVDEDGPFNITNTKTKFRRLLCERASLLDDTTVDIEDPEDFNWVIGRVRWLRQCREDSKKREAAKISSSNNLGEGDKENNSYNQKEEEF